MRDPAYLFYTSSPKRSCSGKGEKEMYNISLNGNIGIFPRTLLLRAGESSLDQLFHI